jgi:archaellum component FlaC
MKGPLMPTVDFTLQDIRSLIGEEITQKVPPIVERVVEPIVERVVESVVESVVGRVVTEHFTNFIDNNFAPALEDIDSQFDEVRDRLDRLETEVKGVRRLVRKHSADISELQAAKGL